MTARQVVRRMKDLDPTAVLLSQVGSHAKWQVKAHCQIVVPMHTGDIPVGTLASIRRQGEHCLGRRWLR